MANLIRPWMTDIIQKSQHCGPHGNTIFDAAAAVRDVVAYAEISGTPLRILSIDFKEAFDKISHDYLFELLWIYGFSERFQRRIKGVYYRATSTIQINGYRSHPIPIRSSVRQGCPLSMLLFALCLNPRIRTLDPERIPVQWLTRPQFNICPRKRHRAVLWTLAKLVIFRTQQRRDLTLHDFIDFMRRTKWKMYQAQKRNEHVGDYLTFIDTES